MASLHTKLNGSFSGRSLKVTKGTEVNQKRKRRKNINKDSYIIQTKKKHNNIKHELWLQIVIN